jgi:hypothetical protein
LPSACFAGWFLELPDGHIHLREVFVLYPKHPGITFLPQWQNFRLAKRLPIQCASNTVVDEHSIHPIHCVPDYLNL